VTETTVTLMTPVEMSIRLESGEDALDLSIEKWERIALWGLAGNSIFYKDYEAASCGLCHLYLYNSLERCGKCPYYLYFGHACDEEDGHWADFHEKCDYDTAIAMRDALVEIKENFDYEE